MKIGIIGAGYIGATTARLFVEAGHEVAICNSRSPETLRDLVSSLGSHARAATVEEVAAFGEVVLLAIPLKDYPTLPAETLQGKIVVDALNYYPERDGQIAALDRDEAASSELVARHLEGARVVKGFNTIWYKHLESESKKDVPVDERRVIFIAADDPEAAAVVERLIEEIGFGAVNTGSLAASRQQQPGTPFYNRDITVAEAKKVLAGESK